MEGLEHAYGPRVHLSSNPLLGTWLARMGAPETELSVVLELVRSSYRLLLADAIGTGLPTVEASVTTRMAELHPEEGHWIGRVLDQGAGIVVADIIRGGMIPSQVAFEMLVQALPGGNVRLDHLHLSRRAAPDGSVAGADLTGSKIGGSVEGAVLIVPDPMGATGSTIVQAYEHYVEHHGRPARVLALPLIATPEFLRNSLDSIPELEIHAGRIDRGLSPADVLARGLGEDWDRERGLNDQGYIVPGAGGVGEVLNNSWC